MGLSAQHSSPAAAGLPVAELRRHIDGQVLLPADDDFATEISGFDPSVHSDPQIVVGVDSAADVVVALDFARRHGMRVSVAGSGHADLPALAGGMLLTTRRLDAVTVDASGRTAVVGAGADWTDVLERCTPLGLAAVCGSAPHVGAVGYLLGGGMGPLGRTFGFSSDWVRAFDVVTADGVRRTAGADSEPDLFWALRGGKGSLAVVLATTVELIELGEIWGGSWYVDESAIPSAFAAFQRLATPDLTDALTLSFAVLRMPDLPTLPDVLRGKTVGHVRVGYTGDPAAGAQLIAPLQAAGPALAGGVGPLPYAEIGSIHSDPVRPTVHATGGTLLGEFPPAALDAVLALAGPQTQSPLTIAEVRHLGGAMARPGAGPDAVGGRDAHFGVWMSSVIGAESDRPAHRAAVRAVIDALQPWSTGVQVNFLGNTNTADEYARAWPQTTAARLATVRRTYDPDGLLHYQPV